MRRVWQPVCLSSELTELPLAIRILGEDLVVFRDKSGRVGVLNRHCSHRGTSLEYGIVSERGIRCCYHGWLFDIDGTILETPGEPPASRIKDTVMHGAYPAQEYKGLVFAYMGPSEQKPQFPILDTYDTPNNKMVPYSVWHPCNWLQIKENFVDPAHAYFLHSNVTTVQFSDAWAEMPTYDWAETPDGQGMYYITVRRIEDRVWVRSNHIWLPNVGQVAGLLERAEKEKFFHRVSITRWTVPIDDTHAWIIGWRHFNDVVDPWNEGKPEECGRDSVDFVGQTGNRSYEEKQRLPGDWDAQTSQRPIAVHALEHLGSTDIGVAMWRRLLRKSIRGEIAFRSQLPRSDGDPIHTFTHDTVLHIPVLPGSDERATLKTIGREVLAAILDASRFVAADRQAQIRKNLEAVKSKYVAAVVE
jgi:phenylpropionate dioxygenase-like ring-hydroxylating dioxygenase large terminal subunit